MEYMGDMIIRRAELEKLSNNVRDVTNIVLYGGLSAMIAGNIISETIVAEIIVIGIVNKSVKYLMRNRKKLISNIKTKLNIKEMIVNQ
ncbi:hypothetical protein [Clostridium sp.]|uniref:hypothetical protein n=2 Tax=unclassified Clostridium TaxID=2614128 RepID=UPI0028A03232|nr:hypothetical protein [Clostridium sp.]